MSFVRTATLARRKNLQAVSRAVATDASAARLIHRAAFGATAAEIASVRSVGYRAWVEAQLASTTPMLIRTLPNVLGFPDPNNYSSETPFTYHAFTSSDQLRIRVANALNIFFPINMRIGAAANYARRDWGQLLVDGAFGNFRTLIENVSKNTFMGVWLSFKGNAKATGNTQPDENYAREIMQLFTLGLWELNLDGTRKKTGTLNPTDPRYVPNGTADVPTYTLSDIRGLSRVFTGWSGTNYWDAGFGSYESADGPMIQYPAYHELGLKEFLGVTIPPNTDGQASLTIALDTLFNNTNLPPFFCKQMIQRLVTSNPSPEYVARVASAFVRDPITGTRGDMKAVWRAILLDQEALAPATLSNPKFGKLRDPFVASVSRYRGLSPLVVGNLGSAVGPESGLVAMALNSNNSPKSGQFPMIFPSVFGNFLFDHSPAGEMAAAGLLAPEFQMLGETSLALEASVRANTDRNDLDYVGFDSSWGGASSVNGDITLYRADSISNTPALVDRLILVLAPEQINSETRATILTRVNEISADNWQFRFHTAWQMIIASPNHWVQR